MLSLNHSVVGEETAASAYLPLAGPPASSQVDIRFVGERRLSSESSSGRVMTLAMHLCAATSLHTRLKPRSVA